MGYGREFRGKIYGIFGLNSEKYARQVKPVAARTGEIVT